MHDDSCDVRYGTMISAHCIVMSLGPIGLTSYVGLTDIIVYHRHLI